MYLVTKKLRTEKTNIYVCTEKNKNQQKTPQLSVKDKMKHIRLWEYKE